MSEWAGRLGGGCWDGLDGSVEDGDVGKILGGELMWRLT